MNNLFYLNPNEVRDLCAASDDIIRSNKHKQISGWESRDFVFNESSNFKAVTYIKGNSAVICFVGTDPKSFKDQYTNAKMPFGVTQQMREADAYYQDIKRRYPHLNISIAGHSEGGSEAQYVCIKNGGIPTYTYNAYMIGSLVDRVTREAMNRFIVNFRHQDDVISKLGKDIGMQVIVPSPSRMKVLPFGNSRYGHTLKNMGDCQQGIPLEQYKLQNPNFLDKIQNAVFTRKNISELETEDFKVLKEEIYKRAGQKEIFDEQEAYNMTRSGDVIYIPAYTRDDGTEVTAHYRHLPNT